MSIALNFSLRLESPVCVCPNTNEVCSGAVDPGHCSGSCKHFPCSGQSKANSQHGKEKKKKGFQNSDPCEQPFRNSFHSELQQVCHLPARHKIIMTVDCWLNYGPGNGRKIFSINLYLRSLETYTPIISYIFLHYRTFPAIYIFILPGSD